LGRGKKVTAGQNAYSHVHGIMRAAKKWGWNPLTLMGSVSPMGGTPADNASIGNAIANIGSILSDDMSLKRAETAKLERLNQTQDRLQRKLDAITLRPPVPGIYGRVPLPSDPEVFNNDQAPDPRVVDPTSGAQIAGPAGTPDPAVTPVDTTYVTNSGEELDLPEGVDLEDVGTGWLMNKYGNLKRAFTPWLSSSPAVRREFTRDTLRASVGARFPTPEGGLKPTDSRMPTRTPWWMDLSGFPERAAKAKPLYDWPGRPGKLKLRYQ